MCLQSSVSRVQESPRIALVPFVPASESIRSHLVSFLFHLNLKSSYCIYTFRNLCRSLTMRASTLNLSIALLVASAASQRLDHPPLQDNLDNLKDGFNANLHPAGSSQNPYDDGQIPQGCKDIVTEENLNPADIQVVSVKYDDVSLSFSLNINFCHQGD